MCTALMNVVLRFHMPSFSVCYFADFLFKFLVIGNAGTGKSCILHQFIENKCESMCVDCSDFEVIFSAYCACLKCL